MHAKKKVKRDNGADDPIASSRRELPMYRAKDDFLKHFAAHDALTLMGETGSGKTTQVPQFILEGGYVPQGYCIGISQPRRVAAITIAARVATEMKCKLGDTVGYSVRFDHCSSSNTKIKYMTDGLLTREAMLDPLLSNYSVIILDEAHERTLHTDILFGIVKKAWQLRNSSRNNHHSLKKLKVVIMSATLNASLFSAYFNNAKMLLVEGRQYPVDIVYTPQPEPDYLDAAFITVMQVHTDYPDGDVLVFLPGQEEIESLERMLTDKIPLLPPRSRDLIICPIFSVLPHDQQMKVFEKPPPNTRKIVLATNIAETSITISGIRYVVDCGVVKQKSFHSKVGLESLQATAISKAAARQRAGRAGRDGPGTCFRVYTEATFMGLDDDTVPEIMRTSMAGVVLQLLATGVQDVRTFDFIERPPLEALHRAISLLLALKAIVRSEDSAAGASQKLTAEGRKMADFPLEPMYSKAILASAEYACTHEVISIIAMIATENIFFSPREKRDEASKAKRRFVSPEGDHHTLLNVFNSYADAVKHNASNSGGVSEWCRSNFINERSMKRACEIREQLRELCLQHKVLSTGGNGNGRSREDRASAESIGKALLSGFAQQIAILQPDGSSFRTLHENQPVHIHPSSVLINRRPDYVLYDQLVLTSKVYIRDLMIIDGAWIQHVIHKT